MPSTGGAVNGLRSSSAVATELAAIEQAINAILTGGAVASYSHGGRSVTRMSIRDLYALRRELRVEQARCAAAENGTSALFGRGRVTGLGNS